jgi:hypothetical protein
MRVGRPREIAVTPILWQHTKYVRIIVIGETFLIVNTLDGESGGLEKF